MTLPSSLPSSLRPPVVELPSWNSLAAPCVGSGGSAPVLHALVRAHSSAATAYSLGLPLLSISTWWAAVQTGLEDICKFKARSREAYRQVKYLDYLLHSLRLSPVPHGTTLEKQWRYFQWCLDKIVKMRTNNEGLPMEDTEALGKDTALWILESADVLHSLRARRHHISTPTNRYLSGLTTAVLWGTIQDSLSIHVRATSLRGHSW